MNLFAEIATIIAQPKYYDYAYKLTGNKDDAYDLVSDTIIHINDNIKRFHKVYKQGSIERFLFRVIKNEFLDGIEQAKSRSKKAIMGEVDFIQSPDVENISIRKASEKLKHDKNNDTYYPLLFKKVAEFGGVDKLAKATGISINTIYTGLKKYKSDLMNVKKILLITPLEIGGVGYHRILKPYAELAETRNDIHLGKTNAYINGDHDIIVFNRVIGSNYTDDRAIINEAKICGQRVICDIDDYWVLPPGHILESYYNKHWITKRIEQNIREAHTVTTTNEVLALKILKLNKNVVILPNAINENDAQWINRHIKDTTYRFGFVGSRAHTNDVPILRKACNLMHRSDMDFQFIYVGWGGDQDHASQLFQEVFSSRGTGNDRYGKISAKPISEYGLSYNMLDCALAPLEDNLFNRCKSNLKVLEAAAHSLPIICSKVHPYYGTDFDNAALFADAEYDWYKQMNKLIKNPVEGHKRGADLREILLKNFTYKQINKLRSEII